MLIIAAQDTLAKYLSLIYPVPMVAAWRYGVHLLVLALVLGPRLGHLLRTEQPWMQAGRSVLLYVLTILFITAITLIPIADGTAIMFVAPILVTALSVPLLGEKVGMRRWAGVLVGFIGALIVVRPGSGLFGTGSFLALGAAFCFACFQISTRILSRTDHALTTLFYSSVGGTVISLAVLPFFYEAPAWEHVPLLVLLGIVGAVSHFALISAFVHAEAAAVTPFTYTSLIWTTLLGFVVFSEFPDNWTIFGAFIIAVSGVYIHYRERMLNKRRDKD